MTKTIMLTNRKGEPFELVLCNAVDWMVEYRDQFGRDIVPSLMPLLMSVTDLAAGLAEEGVDFNKVEAKDVAKLLGSDSMVDAVIKLSGLEIVDFLNIVWALNKAAEEDIPDPRRWVKQFDEFPLDEIGPVVLELLIRGVVSSKNWERLTEAWKGLKPAEKKKKKTTKNH